MFNIRRKLGWLQWCLWFASAWLVAMGITENTFYFGLTPFPLAVVGIIEIIKLEL